MVDCGGERGEREVYSMKYQWLSVKLRLTESLEFEGEECTGSFLHTVVRC